MCASGQHIADSEIHRDAECWRSSPDLCEMGSCCQRQNRPGTSGPPVRFVVGGKLQHQLTLHRTYTQISSVSGRMLQKKGRKIFTGGTKTWTASELRVPVKADRPGYPQVKREFERSALSLIAEDTPLLKLSLMVRGFGLSHLPIQAQIAKLGPNVFEIP